MLRLRNNTLRTLHDYFEVSLLFVAQGSLFLSGNFSDVIVRPFPHTEPGFLLHAYAHRNLE